MFVVTATVNLGPVEFGRLSFVLALTSLFYVITNIGLHNVEIRDEAKDLDKANLYFTSAILIKLALAVVSVILIALVVQVIGASNTTAILIYLLGVAIVIEPLYHSVSNTFIAHERMIMAGLFSHGSNILKNLAGSCLFLIGYDIYDLAVWWLIISVVFLFVALHVVKKSISGFKLEFDREVTFYILKETWPFALSALLFVGYWRLDMLLLAYFKGYQQVGWYSAAYRIWDALLIVPASVMLAYLPAAAKLYKESVDSFNDTSYKTIKFLIVLTIGLALIVYLFADLIVVLLGNEYANTVVALKILIWALPIFSMRLKLMQIFNIANKQLYILYSDVGALLLNLGLNVIFIPKYGFLAPPYIMIITETLAVAYLLYYYLRSVQLIKIKSRIPA